MEYRGKVILGAVGALWGVLGIAVGLTVGHFLFDKPSEDKIAEGFSEYKQRQSRFLFHVFSLCAKMAKAKGAIEMPEIRFMEQLMKQQFRLNDKGREAAIRIWKQAKESPLGFDEMARAFFDEFRTERHSVINMMDLLFAVAAADQHLHPRQEQRLLLAANIFQISRLQYERIKQQYFHVAPPKAWQPLDPHYALLGATPKEDMESIKKKWRALAMQWHPDKATAKGATPNQIKHSQKKFQEINEAYELIRKERDA